MLTTKIYKITSEQLGEYINVHYQKHIHFPTLKKLFIKCFKKCIYINAFHEYNEFNITGKTTTRAKH